MKRSNVQVLRLVLACVAFFTLSREVNAQRPHGIVDSRPAFGPVVKVDQGWMVAYREQIPGTDFTFRMIPVPGGTFLMGSPPEEPGHKADESPQVSIKVAPMWVGQCEVTQREYQQYQELYTVFKEVQRSDRNYKELDRSRVDVVSAPTAVYDPQYQFEFGDDPNHPAVSMTRYAAMQYTKWLSIVTKQQYRLPTEAEWEYACRAGSQSRYNWGDQVNEADKHAAYFDNSESLSHVGSKRFNVFNLHDMHGNASEWTVNAYTPDGYQWLKKQELITATDAVRWPTGSDEGVVRGGSIDSELREIRSAARLASDEEEWKGDDAFLPKSPWWYTSDPARTVGFRVFRSATPLADEVISKFWNHTSDDLQQDIQSRLIGGRGAVGIVDEDVVKKLHSRK
ncbi:MAG: SUMF1/EgtB/PvdO family nonheme iron enzyme [Pirellulaceae bacterium]